MTENSNSPINTDQLVDDLKAVARDLDDILRSTASAVGEKATAARARLEANLQDAKARLAEADKVIRARGRVYCEATDDFVRENPWQSVGLAAGLGFLVGILASRR